MVRFSVLLLVLLGLMGCPRRIQLDAGPESDAEEPDTPSRRDTDGDGLCDGTEGTLGLDLTRADTDGDSYPDGLEYSVGTDGSMNDSPARDALVFLSGAAGSIIDAPVNFSVRGMGETFAGAFAASPSFIPVPDRDAFTYYAGARALGAVPMENVISVEGERFLGVRGRALLVSSITFEARAAETECMRVYPFLYQVQTTHDGRIYGQARRWLVVAPPGMSPGRGIFCALEVAGGCR